MPRYRVTACYYETADFDAENEEQAIEMARKNIRLPGGHSFDEYEAECLDEDE